MQRRIAHRLDAISQIPDYLNYLVLVFVQMTGEEVSTRSVAGLLAKNHLYFNAPRVSPESLAFVQHMILPALSFSDTVLRNVATQIIAVLMQVVKPVNWIDGLSTLTQAMDSANLDEVEAALDDTNLRRLISLFEQLRDKSQLIVITHQKPTMEVADALYSVSMRGDGITQVISQRIRGQELGALPV